MIFDIWHFNKNSQENLELSRKNNYTLEELLNFCGYSDSFKTLYLLPMTGAIWSMSYVDALKFPAETFLTFCINHRLLQVNDRPMWRTVKDGSINYVNSVKSRIKHIHLSCEIISITKKLEKLTLSTAHSKLDFDKVILATHAPTTARLIRNDFPDLANELSNLKVTSNKVTLHEDISIMPQNRSCWSAWNVNAQEQIYDKKNISLTYYINKLQPLPTERNFLVTLNYPDQLKNVHQSFIYNHPKFDFSSILVQKRLPELQGRYGLYFAGAWTRYGFHEDGILSAVNVAHHFGVKPPWI
jgi:predicted NAD/FAD-binding protein